MEIIVYQGNIREKAEIRKKLFKQLEGQHDVTSESSSSTTPPFHRDPILILSYDSIRKDLQYFTPLLFHHLILDEGHLIKNSSSQLARSIKMLRSLTRLILSGTPLSNHVLEIWSLFDFLMPTYLGTEGEFRSKYAIPIQKARKNEIIKSASSSSKHHSPPDDGDVELDSPTNKHRDAITVAGNLALEHLHRRVLPFMLRRTKQDVLAELPPKIVQDVYVDLTPLQRELYRLIEGEEDQIEQAANGTIQGQSKDESMASPSSHHTLHTFQALHYLRKLCSHPGFVFTPSHPDYERLQTTYFPSGSSNDSSIFQVCQSPKLIALKELLLECGIGRVQQTEQSTSSSASSSSVTQVSKKKKKKKVDTDESTEEELLLSESSTRHRVLIFAQLKSTLDRVEYDLFGVGGRSQQADPDRFETGSINYLRLDGSTPPSHRFELVQTFNSDTRIDCMLLTTSIGGLGLNLTGADTIIFLEHDYNPNRDLQAIDRVHRFGQRAEAVNIYRILTRATVEQRIMCLQRMKIHMTQTVVSHENATMKTMDTTGVMERLQTGVTTPTPTTHSVSTHADSASASSFLTRAGVDLPLPTEAEAAEEEEIDAGIQTFLEAYKKR